MLFAGMAGATAADLAVYTPAPPAPPIYWTWTGFYIGGNIGGGWANSSGSAALLTPGAATNGVSGTTGTVSGVVGGGQIGYNWQPNPYVVLGVEWDLDGSGQRTSASAACFGIVLANGCTLNASAGVNWFSTLRGRLGFTADRWLFYVTGGGAWQNVGANASVSVPGGTVGLFSTSTTRSGYSLGFGFETAVWDHFIIGAEYLYLNTGNWGNTLVVGASNPFGAPAGSIINTSVSNSNNIVRVRASYKF